MRRKNILAGLGLLLLPGMLPADDWTEKIRIKGDLRYRHETIQVEDRDARNRHRIRARLGITAEPAGGITLGLQLASGSDDPVSTNQSLDGGFTSKDIRLDLAYVDLHTDAAPGLHIIAGKMNNPFHAPGKTELVWDGDLNPEGGALQYRASGDTVGLFASAGGFAIDERSSDCDAWLFGGQAGLNFQASPDVRFTGGFSYYDYGNILGYTPVYDGDSFGNTLGEDGRFAHDYNLVEFFAELGLKAGGVPVNLFFDYVQNVAQGLEGNNRAWLAGMTIGKTKDPGSWAARCNYREVEADAVFGTFTDSDFIGGGSDGKGSECGVDVQIARAWTAGLSYFLNERITTGDAPEYRRLQLDAAFKF